MSRSSKTRRGPAPASKAVLGIDFGTTRTVVAVADRGNYPVVSFETNDGDSVEWFPSIVAVRGDDFRFGFDALDVAREPDWKIVRSMKRLLATPDVGTEPAFGVGRGAAEVLPRFLEALSTALRERSNVADALRDGALEVVIAAPANAFCAQRFYTLEAFRHAGFKVRALLNEPSAAGFEYAHRYARTMSSSREGVIVYDLGGGTFDASLVRMSGARHDVVRAAGISRLGGDDFDAALAELALAEAGREGGLASLEASAAQKLLDDCRAAKEALTPSARKVSVDVDAALGLPSRASSVATADYYDACTPLVERTIEAMAPLFEDGALPFDVAGLYVVGGASSLPLVGRVLKARFGRRVHRSPYPHAAVAIGLAIFGDDTAGFELVDRFSRNFGVFREEEDGRRPTYDPIVTHDVPLPAPGHSPVVVRRRYRAAHDVGHYRFFECATFDDHGVPRGDMAPVTELYFPFAAKLRGAEVDLVSHSVSRLGGEGPLVEERYSVDENGVVRVTIVDLESGFEKSSRLAQPTA